MLRKGFKSFIFILITALVSSVNLIKSIDFAYAYPLAKNDLELTVVAMGREYKFYYPEIDFYKSEPYLKNIEEVVDGIYLDTVIRPTDACVKLFTDREYPFEFVKEKQGKGIDKEDLIVKIERALRVRAQRVVAKEITLKPSINVEKLQKSTYRRAFFSTNYTYSSEERKENINLCAKIIGGLSIEPYEEFSFNEVVGERSKERGFKSARVIEKGKFIDGIGGGVCQVSSTIYNAVLLSGLKVTERHSHSMTVSYVEPSFDAMVSMGYADLRFVNDTASTVFLIVNTVGDSIAVSIYGEQLEYTYKRSFEVVERITPPDFTRTFSNELESGEERISVYPKDGLKSIGYLEVYKNGSLRDKIKLSEDKYYPLQGEILYG